MSFSTTSFDPLWVGVAEPLRQRIIEGTIPLGQPLSENQLAAEFGVSRTPVREALRILMEEGLIEMLPGRKLRVTLPDPTDIREIYDMRWVLESEALRRLATNAELTEQTCLKLEEHCKKGDQALLARDRQSLALANGHFHEEIVLALNNHRMMAQFRTVLNLITMYRHQTLQSDAWATAGSSDHVRLTDLIRNRRLQAALNLLRNHLNHAQAVLAERLSRPLSG